MFNDHRSSYWPIYPHYPYYNPYYPYHNPYYPYYSDYYSQYASVDQGIYNSGYMNDVSQTSYINQIGRRKLKSKKRK
jgi:hypothetical protein